MSSVPVGIQRTRGSAIEAQRCRTRLWRLNRIVVPPPDVAAATRTWGSHGMCGLLLSAIAPAQPVEWPRGLVTDSQRPFANIQQSFFVVRE